MQEVSTIWNDIVSTGNYHTEVKAVISDAEYDMTQLASLVTERHPFGTEKPTLGKAVAGEIDITAFLPVSTFPKMGEIDVYVRLAGFKETEGSARIISDIASLNDATLSGDNLVLPNTVRVVSDIVIFPPYSIETIFSEWIPKGVYFIDTREGDNDYVSIHGYDRMMMAEQPYPSTEHDWPYSDIGVVNEIAQTIGVAVDDRTTELINQNFPIQLPEQYASDGSEAIGDYFTMRDTLAGIAGLYGGSFIVNDFGKLQLLCPWDHPIETYYLTDENGNYITVGGDRIYIGA